MTVAQTRPCPQCDSVGLWIPAVYDGAYVDYYRCYKCANVWTVPKDSKHPEPMNGHRTNIKVWASE